MSVVTKFHRLFEVKILHEYFLLYDDHLTYFDLTLNEQAIRLERRLLQGQYRLMNDLHIEPTMECDKILRNHRLKMLQTPTGMVVACEGKQKVLADGTEVIVPGIPLSPNLEFTFMIKVKNTQFRNYTSLPLRPSSSGIYFFSNSSDNVSNSIFATLSKPVETFQINKPYLPGDLALHSGILREAIANTNNNNHWEDIESGGYVNENDRNLHSKKIQYFPKTTEIGKPMTFILRDYNNGNELKKIVIDKILKTGVQLNFLTTKINGMEVPLPDGRYTLEIENSIATLVKSIYLSSEFSQSDFGMISIRVGETNTQYRFLGDKANIIQPHPKFEIRLRSRRTFWRYQSRYVDKKLEPNGGAASFFVDDQNNDTQDLLPYRFLITKGPQKLANLPIQIKNNVGLLERFPQPGPSPLKVNKLQDLASTEPPGRIYSDVYISTVNGKIGIVN